MFTANAFVIYFTIGVPFGVLSIYLTTSRLMAIKAAWFAVHLALWPAFAAKALVTSLLRSSKPINSSNTLSVQNHLRSQIEAVIPETTSLSKKRSLLFEFDRFVSISEAAADARANSEPSEMPVHSIVTHPFPRVTAKCCQRRLLSQLSRHQMDAYLSICNLADEQGINLPNSISSEMDALIKGNSTSVYASSVSNDRLAA